MKNWSPETEAPSNYCAIVNLTPPVVTAAEGKLGRRRHRTDPSEKRGSNPARNGSNCSEWSRTAYGSTAAAHLPEPRSRRWFTVCRGNFLKREALSPDYLAELWCVREKVRVKPLPRVDRRRERVNTSSTIGGRLDDFLMQA
ncbi:50S rRNA methyltransferase [Anopheles sinensis]|uniref:50S rRNA methyltransferase n=1 Tax=Anopheles sinensis TaxID=74873 RepID=A0A084WGE6_ANOSI|nr:50S rRNA methyltransferase [Anopheles sinensis]